MTTLSTPVITRPRPHGALRRLLRDPLGAASAGILLAIIVIALLAPVLPLADPNLVDLSSANTGPTSAHPLGADSAGRDILSRLIWGSRINLLGAALAVGVAVVIGLPTGLLAGYVGGALDRVFDWVNSLNMALPGIVVVLAVRAVLGPNVWVAMAVFGVMLAPSVFRIVRAAVQNVRGELYIDAARVAGLSDLRIISRHVLSVVRAPVIIQVARLASIAIAIQAGLEFLGVSDNTVPSWGGMLNEAFRRMATTPLPVLWPSAVIALCCMSLVVFGNALRDALEDRGLVTRTRATAVPEPSDSPARPGTLLSIRDLRVAYGAGESEVEVVHGVDLDIAPGEVLGLVGESGSGKTQIAYSVLGLLPEGGRVSGGSVYFDGDDVVAGRSAARQRLRGEAIAYIPQEPMSNLDPTQRIGRQLTVPMQARLGMSRAEARAYALELLARVGIPDPDRTFRAYPHEISGGMAQRVLIAGAVASRPRLLIADEPTTALDVTVQAEVLDLLRELQKESGMAILLVTHNFGVVADVCDRVAVMERGLIVESGDVTSVFTAPTHEYTRRLLGSVLDGGPARDNPFGAPADPAAGTERWAS